MKPLHILLIADGRSPITQRWIELLNLLDVQITFVSTYPFDQILPVSQSFIIPVAFSQFLNPKKSTHSAQKGSTTTYSNLSSIIRRFRGLFLQWRYRLGPLTLKHAGRKLKKLIKDTQPDLVHALRIPFEGLLAQYTPAEIPLVVSIWGNDLTLHANNSNGMGTQTRRTMQRINGLMADVQRDINLAREWSFSPEKTTLVVPGAGGIDLELIRSAHKPILEKYTLPKDRPLIINPRGIRAYTQTDVFFQAIPLILQRFPDSFFLCPGMSGEKQALDWVKRLRIENNICLLPSIPQTDLWALFYHTPITISLTLHDGTPNTLLEAMACGSYPIAGDIESIREWVTPGVNGILVEPHKPQALADAVISTLNNPHRVQKAAVENLQRIQKKGEINWVLQQIETFYAQLISEVLEK